MSSKLYRQAYEYMTDKQKEAMYELYQGCINHDGHSWATYTDIENAVAKIVMAQKSSYDDGYNKCELDWQKKLEEADDKYSWLKQIERVPDIPEDEWGIEYK